MRKVLLAQKETAVFANTLIDTGELSLDNGVLLTDDFAPIENLLIPTMQTYFSAYRTFYQDIFKESSHAKI